MLLSRLSILSTINHSSFNIVLYFLAILNILLINGGNLVPYRKTFKFLSLILIFYTVPSHLSQNQITMTFIFVYVYI